MGQLIDVPYVRLEGMKSSGDSKQRYIKLFQSEWWHLPGSLVLCSLGYVLLSEPWARPFTIENDNLNLRLPISYFTSRSLREGVLPLWDPFSGGGAPIHTLFSSVVITPTFIFSHIVTTSVEFASYLESMLVTGIAFLGMWVLLSRSLRWYQFVGSLAYALSGYMIFQNYLNVEGAYSAAAIPWIFIGLAKGTSTRAGAYGCLAFGVAVATTSGYLGMNILGIYPITMWLLLTSADEFRRRRTTWNELRNFGFRIAMAIMLGALPLVFPIVETVRNGYLGVFTSRDINPYAGSVKISSILTLIGTFGLDPTNQDQWGGGPAILFVPFVVLYLIVVSLRKRVSGMMPTLVTAVVTYILLLSNKYPFVELVHSVLPGWNSIRYHGWLTIYIVFFILYAGALGSSKAESSRGGLLPPRHVIYLSLITTTISIFVAGGEDKYLIVAIGAVGLITVYKKIFTLSLISIAILQIVAATAGIGNPWPFSRDAREVALISKTIEDSTNSAQIIGDKRIISDDRFTNAHYFLLQPSVFAYQPGIHPISSRVFASGRSELLENYIISNSEIPINVQVLQISSNEFQVKVLGAAQTAQATIPYSANWRLSVNGTERIPSQSEIGFIEVGAIKSGDIVKLEYRPIYALPLILLGWGSWCIMIVCVVVEICRSNCSKKRGD